VAEANIADHLFLKLTLDSIVIKRPNPKRVYQNLLADKDYSDSRSRNIALTYGYDAHIPQKKNARVKILKRPGRRKARRWVVEQTFGCINRNRSIFIRWSKDPENYEALLNIAAAVLIFNRSNKK
jgi:hypothetical protein